MKNILIIGYGQIGQSIERLYDKERYNVFHFDIKDEKSPEFGDTENIDVMHICTPFNETFIPDSIDYIHTFGPKLVIIESTVLFMSTDIIASNVDAHVVHSPVMGKHPNLTESIQTFKKVIAGYTTEAVTLAEEHYKELGIEIVKFDSPEESEIAKLLCTTYYGWNIMFMQEVHALCEEWNLNFDQIYTQMNQIYNEGYNKMGNPQFTRPVLKYMGEDIGGHCVKPNLLLLKESKMLLNIVNPILKRGKNVAISVDSRIC